VSLKLGGPKCLPNATFIGFFKFKFMFCVYNMTTQCLLIWLNYSETRKGNRISEQLVACNLKSALPVFCGVIFRKFLSSVHGEKSVYIEGEIVCIKRVRICLEEIVGMSAWLYVGESTGGLQETEGPEKKR
jgi:hypothetical protein